MMNMDQDLPKRAPRRFLPEEFAVSDWAALLPYFERLKESQIDSIDALKSWLAESSELDAFLEEDMAWRYIKMNVDTRNEEFAKAFHFFVEEIEPNAAPFSNAFNIKLVNSDFNNELGAEYLTLLRSAKKQIELFREENIPLNTQLQAKSQEYGAISAGMMVEIDGEQLTMQQAAKILKDPDREKRQATYEVMGKRRLEDKTKLDELYHELITLRHKVASNAGFDNYRDYKFEDMGRFDYTKADCFNFHKSIAKEVVPLLNRFDEERKTALNVDRLRPWDTAVDTTGKPPLKPFEGGRELIDKTVECFNRIDPYFAQCISIMDRMGHLDLESKEGKAPGGFNYPLYEIGVPFIYMNAVGSLRDLTTMVHEGGHAIHSFLTRDLELVGFKSFPSEVAELASMSMELISMEYWDTFFEDPEELKRAKREQLEQVLDTLPWVAQIDKFQHWIYENPTHSSEDREVKWMELCREFGSEVVDWEGYEPQRRNLWQKQLHLYEVPFYYIEYGMAQLGAIAIWRNFKHDPEKALQQYKAALSLGYTKPIGEIYATAGIQFDFSTDYVKELAAFVSSELAAL